MNTSMLPFHLQQMPTPFFPSYAHGGTVHPSMINQYVHFLRSMGAGKDKILAHINPEEAEELSEEHGHDINPHTGLPQFGFWGRVGKGVSSAAQGTLSNMAASAMAPSTPGAPPQSWGQQLGNSLAGGLVNSASNYMNRPADAPSQPMPSFSQMMSDVGHGALNAGASMAQSYLPKVDQYVSQKLPQMATQFGNKYGGQFGGDMLGGLTNSFAQNYNQAGGLSGAANPYLNYAQGNGPKPTQSLAQTAQNFGSNVGQGMYNQGVQGAQNALQNFDQQMAPALQHYGSQYGGQLGGAMGGQFGSDFGQAFGGNLGQAFGQTSNQMGGLSSFAQPYMQSYGQSYGGGQQQQQPYGQPHARGGRIKKKKIF